MANESSTQPLFLRTTTPTIDIYIKLAQYPILADRFRERMRQELFGHGLITHEKFEQEVRDLSIASQRREGLGDPYDQEDSQTWQIRFERIRDMHTDALFADNFGSARLDSLIEEVLNSRSSDPGMDAISFNPEIAPWEMLFRQGEIYERMWPEERERHGHHLEEIKVVLIKRLMSDQLPYIGVAKRVLTIADLRQIHQSLIGTGKIGGKAAGIYLAWRILHDVDDTFDNASINIPDSYFIGTDVIYEFFLMNKLEHHMNQKYRTVQEMRTEYPRIVADFRVSELPDYVVTQVREVLASLGNSPVVVRSSSLLEDNFGYSFAGKYSSFICPNQGTAEENLAAILDAIRRVFASTVNPDALRYRKKYGLIDYDERMAILLQRVTGQWHGDYFYPDVAGVGFSYNPFRWSPEIIPGAGFLRLVTGLSTRAVERVDQDYPRLIALSHPHLRTDNSVEGRRIFAQRLMAAIGRRQNTVTTIPVREGLEQHTELLPLIAALDTGENLLPFPADYQLMQDEIEDDGDRGGGDKGGGDHIVLTFDGLIKDQTFTDIMRETLHRLESIYREPVDLEFAIQIEPGEERPGEEDARHTYRLFILECRPLSARRSQPRTPKELREALPTIQRRLFSTPTRRPAGLVEAIDYLVFVDPDVYYSIEDNARREAIADAIIALNDLLPAGRFGLIGPGRWGSLNNRLCVPVTFTDVSNSALLVEISPSYTPAPELAYGTDFYEDIIDAGILVLGIQLTPQGGSMDWDLLRQSPNQLGFYLPEAADLGDVLRVIDLQAVAGTSLKVVIDGSANEAIAGFGPS